MLTLNFAKKCTKNARFAHWFVEREKNNLRCSKKYVECFAKIEKLKKSPVYYMRRTLNEDVAERLRDSISIRSGA